MCTLPPEETIEHLLFHCTFSESCWQALDMNWQPTGNRLQILEEGRQRWHRPLYMELFMLATWNIWKERNRLLFDGVAPTVASWKSRLKSDLLLLVHRTRDNLHSSILDIVATL
jgi:hypothetical protein